MLPASYSLDKPGVRGEENQRMLRAFRWNLRVLSYISLVVGAFLIYNTISVSVVRRRPEIGILRALGAGRFAVLWLFLGEALLLGLAGSLLGVLLGRILAEGAVGLIADTVNSLYASSRPAQGGDDARSGDRRSRGRGRRRPGVRIRAGARSHGGRARFGDGPRRARAAGAPALGTRSDRVRRCWRCRAARLAGGTGAMASRCGATPRRCWPSARRRSPRRRSRYWSPA